MLKLKMFTSRGQVYPIVIHFWDLVPMIEEQRYTEMLVQNFSIDPDIYGSIGKLLKITFKFIVALQSMGHVFNSCLNFMKPGSQNVTYLFLFFVLVCF